MKSIHDPRYIQFIDLLIKIRVDADVTQEELARRLSKPQSFVAKVENLDRRIDIIELADWLSAIDLTLQDFVNDLRW